MTQQEMDMFIFQSNKEFEWLMQRLGYPEHSLRAFNMTAALTTYVREMQFLWDAR